jgi:hypothetical protein
MGDGMGVPAAALGVAGCAVSGVAAAGADDGAWLGTVGAGTGESAGVGAAAPGAGGAGGNAPLRESCTESPPNCTDAVS